MWEILLNSILNGWLKWVVLLTNCKWAVVNSIRIQKWAVHLQFVKSTTYFLARTMINNFNQPLKTEFNKISHILMGSEIFLSRNF